MSGREPDLTGLDALPELDPVGRRRRLVDALRSLDDAIDADRRRLRDDPGLLVPGRGGGPDVRGGPGAGGAGSGRAVAARLLSAQRRRDLLRRELRDLDLGRIDPFLCRLYATRWLNGLRSAAQLLDELVPDPAQLPLLRPPRSGPIPLATAQAILRARDGVLGGGFHDVRQVRAVTGVTDAVFAHILHTGCAVAAGVEPEPEPQPGPDPATPGVGVLLPLRLETRFDPGRLRVRIIPDDPWFARHEPRAREGELLAVERYLEAVAVATTDAERRQAWDELVAQVTGPRAVHLLRTFVVDEGAGPVVRPLDDGELRTEPAFARLPGFPDQLHLWLARGGNPPERVTTLDVDHSRLLGDPSDPDDPDDVRWFEDWDEAVRAGLAVELGLPGDPEDIDVLYVTGLGAGDPAELFADHRDEGQLGLLAPGTPTNTVDGKPTTHVAGDAATWWEVLQGAPADVDRLVSLALTGDADLLGVLPGPAEPHRAWASTVVSALWPALWGFAGSDVWGAVPATPETAGWAGHALHPEGPFPTLRVGPQPYGILPATLTREWVPAPDDPPTEAPLLARAAELRRRWAQAAEARGTVAGADVDRLLDLMADVPTSPLYRHRRAWPLELWWWVLALLGAGVPWDELEERWRQRYPLAKELGLADPARRYGARAGARRLELPLVVPHELPEDMPLPKVLERLIELARRGPSLFAHTDMVELEGIRVPPNSLLLRLVIRSLQVAIGDVGRETAGEEPPGPEPLLRPLGEPGRLERWIGSVRSQDLEADTPAAAAFRRVVEAVQGLIDIPIPRLEALLRATVDTATHRIDPWLLGPVTRRLQDLLDAGGADLRLGAYGWVDAPRPGTPGPTAGGLLHAPSPAQALTATVLRDRAVNDAEPGRWDLDLTSATVRTANRIADHVRVGAHLAEALGREVERVVAVRADVERLRKDFPVRTEHEGRRVLDGLALLRAAPSSLGLDGARLAELDGLRAAMEAYGDLLVAEAVHHVTQGRAEVAGAAMDAAAGLSRPPALDLLRTPREGRAVATSVVALLRHVDEPVLPADPADAALVAPAAMADASAALFLTEHLGAGPEWTWGVGHDPGTTILEVIDVSLADLGLAPADVLSLSLDDVERLVTEAGAAALGAPAPADCVLVSSAGSERYEAAARLAAVLGRAPAGPDAVTEKADDVIDATAVDADLAERYALVHEVASALVDELAAELALAGVGGDVGGADVGVLTGLVVAARRWGVAPDPGPAVLAAVTTPEEVAERRLVAVARRALDLLGSRLAAAPLPADAALLGRDDLVAALVALVSPTGQLAVLSRLPASALPALSAGGQVDADWLPVVAAVREPLARVELHQLAAGTAVGSGPALSPWTTKPADVWQTDPATGERRLVVAYAAGSLDPGALAPGSLVAVAALDRWNEVVPAEEQTTAAAFGFDAPAAKAPQAVLLAVPPDLDGGLDEELLVRIVAETRELAHARMARLADLSDELRGLLPTVLLPSAGRTYVPLDPAVR